LSNNSEKAVNRITTKFLSVLPTENTENIKKILSKKAKQFETIDYVYVVDQNKVLLGVASLKEILQAHDESKIEDVMIKNIVSTKSHINQEKAVYLALKHGLLSIPVVDKENHLLGIITHKTILSIFHQETREDVLRVGGIHHKIKEIESLKTPVSKLVRARLPSLFLGLLGGLVAATIISNFESVLSTYLALAAFIPVIVYLSDAVGTQSQTLVVRLMALEPGFSIRRYLVREIKIGTVLGAIFSVTLFAAGFFGVGHVELGIAIGISIFISMIFQTFFSTYISMIFEKFRVDPAVASGPIATIISDVTTIAMYFGIATTLLNFI